MRRIYRTKRAQPQTEHFVHAAGSLVEAEANGCHSKPALRHPFRKQSYSTAAASSAT